MGFRFRKSFKVLPGLRLNVGKRGVSLSAGVRGARVTLGRTGTRASIGIPGTGLSYTTRLQHHQMHSAPQRPRAFGFLILLLVAVPAICLLTVTIRDFQEWLPTILGFAAAFTMVGLVVKGLRDRMISNSVDPTAAEPTGAEAQTFRATHQHHGPRTFPRTAESLRMEAQRVLDAAAHEQERLAQALGKYRCFYKHGDEILGPVTLWNVRELVETELLTPDVSVILEGSDYWFTYAQQELRIAPPAGADLSKLEMAAKLSCFYFDQGKETGPLSLLAIFHLIRSGRLSPGVRARLDGSAEWKPACDI